VKPPRRRDVVAGVLLSYRESDAALRARNGTTADLVARGLLNADPWFGRLRIAREELDRLAREGVPTEPRRGRAPKARAPGRCDPESLRNLDIRSLRP
jgi:hypothetical protein